MIGVRRSLLGSTSLAKPAFYADLTQGVFPSWLTYSMASNSYVFDATGSLQTAPNNQTTNSTMTGAVNGVVGSGGSFPTTWSIYSASSLVTTIIGTGTQNGLPYIDIQFSGTPSASFYVLAFGNQVTSSQGQKFIQSATFSLVGGSLANVINCYSEIRTTAGNQDTVFTPTATPTRINSSVYTLPASPSYAVQALYLNVTSGQPINLTLRIAAPQMELVTGAQTTPRPFLPTSGSAYYGPAFDYHPITLVPRGLRKEGAATNYVTNSAAIGSTNGAIGSGGALPTTWAPGTITANTITVQGTGVEKGIPYIDLKIDSSGAGGSRIQFDNPAWGASSAYAASVYIKKTAGNFTGFSSFVFRTVDLPSSTITSTDITGAGSGALGTLRYSVSGTSSGTCTSLRPELGWNTTGAGSVTLRVGLPMLEGSVLFPTSPILTYGAATTRSEAIISFNGAALAVLTNTTWTYGVTTRAIGISNNNNRIIGIENAGGTNRDGCYFSSNIADNFLGVSGTVTPDVTSQYVRIIEGISPTVRSDSAAGLISGPVAYAAFTDLVNAQLGSTATQPRPWYGWFSELALWRTNIPDAKKQLFSQLGNRWV